MEEGSLTSTNVKTRELWEAEKFECSAQSRMRKTKTNEYEQNKDKQNMKRKMRIITSASAASILAFAALAQETTKNAPGAAEYSDQTVAQGTRAERSEERRVGTARQSRLS